MYWFRILYAHCMDLISIVNILDCTCLSLSLSADPFTTAKNPSFCLPFCACIPFGRYVAGCHVFSFKFYLYHLYPLVNLSICTVSTWIQLHFRISLVWFTLRFVLSCWLTSDCKVNHFMTYCDTMTQGLDRVLFVHSSGHEVRRASSIFIASDWGKRVNTILGDTRWRHSWMHSLAVLTILHLCVVFVQWKTTFGSVNLITICWMSTDHDADLSGIWDWLRAVQDGSLKYRSWTFSGGSSLAVLRIEGFEVPMLFDRIPILYNLYCLIDCLEKGTLRRSALESTIARTKGTKL